MWIMTARLCEKFHVLPHAGGLFDQDPETMDKLAAVTSVLSRYDAKELDKVTSE